MFITYNTEALFCPQEQNTDTNKRQRTGYNRPPQWCTYTIHYFVR